MQASLVAALALALIGGFAGITWNWHEAVRQKHEAVLQKQDAERQKAAPGRVAKPGRGLREKGPVALRQG